VNGPVDKVLAWYFEYPVGDTRYYDVLDPITGHAIEIKRSRARDVGGGRNRPFTSSQLALLDEVKAYLGEVLTTAIPGAHWVIYKGHKQDFRNGLIMLGGKG
jgi:hypothetical protein